MTERSKCEHRGDDNAIRRGILPPTVQRMAQSMLEKFESDWEEIVSRGLLNETPQFYASPIDQNLGVLNIPLDRKARFTYCWLIVNTRCLRYRIPAPATISTETQESSLVSPLSSDPSISVTASLSASTPASSISSTPPSSPLPSAQETSLGLLRPFPNKDDNMALVPFIDLLNHTCSYRPSSDPDSYGSIHHDSTTANANTSPPCVVAQTAQSYTLYSPSLPISISTPSSPVKEIYTSYGAHPQDFLFSEYGFTLSPPHTNADEYLELDSIILEDLTSYQLELLEEQGYAGSWLFTPGTRSHVKGIESSAATTTIKQTPAEICFRTQVAAVLVAESNLSSSTTTVTTDPSQTTESQQEQPYYYLQYLQGLLDLSSLSSSSSSSPSSLHTLKQHTNSTISSWISRYRSLASSTLKILDRLSNYDVSPSPLLLPPSSPPPPPPPTATTPTPSAAVTTTTSFSTDVLTDNLSQILLTLDPSEETRTTETKTKRDIASKRLSMLRRRWEEIYESLNLALEMDSVGGSGAGEDGHYDGQYDWF